MGLIWNGENAQRKIEELYALNDQERIKQAQMIRRNIREWAEENFCFSERQMKCLNLLPNNYLDETGFLLARALEQKYPIDVFCSDDSINPNLRKRGDSVEVGWSEKEGFHATYKFTF